MIQRIYRYLSPHLALGVLVLDLAAAQITWTAQDISPCDGTADVSTEGVLIEARNEAMADITVNGVTFRSTANSVNLFDSLFAHDNIKGREDSIARGDYQTLPRPGQRSGRPGFGKETKPERILPSRDCATVQLTGLIMGHACQIQIWRTDVDNVPYDARDNRLLLGKALADNMLLLVDQ